MTEIGREVSMFGFVWHHFTASFTAPKVDLSGRTVLVTGGNAGLGYASVLHFARSNAERIIIASRNQAKCEEAAQSVYTKVPTFKGRIDILELDLSSFDSVKIFCQKVNADKGRLDIVVANAGIMGTKYQDTKDGYESTIQVNDLSTGLMSLLLLPKLVDTAKLPVPPGSASLRPHLTIVASEVHYWAKFAEKDVPGSLLSALTERQHYSDGSERYNVSKLLNLFIAREIAKLPAVTSGAVNVNTVNPGLCKSGFRDDMGPIIAAIFNAISWTTEFGSQNIYTAATQPTKAGAYISDCKETPPSMFVVSEEGHKMQEKFWAESMKLWEGLEPKVAQAKLAA